jgi:integrase
MPERERFTEAFIKGLEPPAKGSRWVWDSELTGFLCRVFAPTRLHPEGVRTFYLSYWLGREHRYRIGSWPDWKVTAARKEGEEIRQRVDRGEDPATVRRELRDAPTMQELWERYRADHLPRKALKSQHDDAVMIEKHVLPIIGKDRRVVEIHHGDIVAMHRAITDSGRPVLANRVVSCASKMFSLALKPRHGETKPWRDHALGNPCRGVARNPEEEKERFLSTPELAAVSDAIAACGETAPANCIRLCLLSGCRPCEALRATWMQFELPGFWIKPALTTKQRKVHKAPLNPPAQELIQRLRKPDAMPSDVVFPGARTGTVVQRLQGCWNVVRQAATVALWEGSSDPKVAKIVADLAGQFGRRPTVAECQAAAELRKVTLPAGVLDVRLYDLRHSYASVGAAGGLSLPIIGRLLGHTKPITTQRYAHLADDPLREATERIGAVITGAGNGGNVVKLRGT